MNLVEGNKPQGLAICRAEVEAEQLQSCQGRALHSIEVPGWQYVTRCKESLQVLLFLLLSARLSCSLPLQGLALLILQFVYTSPVVPSIQHYSVLGPFVGT